MSHNSRRKGGSHGACVCVAVGVKSGPLSAHAPIQQNSKPPASDRFYDLWES